MDRTLSWYEMPIGVQLANVGSEVNRAISWKKRGNEQRTASFCNKAIDFLEIIKTDKKNVNRIGELDFCIEELKDYFFGENKYNTTDESLMRYYDAFLSSVS